MRSHRTNSHACCRSSSLMNPPGDSARACRPSMSLRLQASIISCALSSSSWSLLSVTSGCDRGDVEGSWLVFSSTISASPYARCSSSSAAISCWPSQRALTGHSDPAFLQAMCLPQSQEATPVGSAYDDVSPRERHTYSGRHHSDQRNELKIWTWEQVLRAGFPAVFRVLCVILKASDVSGCACRRVVEDATPSLKVMEPDPYEFCLLIVCFIERSTSHAIYYRQG